MAASPWDLVLDEDTAPSASEPLVAEPQAGDGQGAAPAAGGSPWDDVLGDEPSPVIRQDNQPVAKPVADPEAKPEQGFVAGLGRSFRSGLSMTPEGAAGLADLFEDMTGDDDPNSTAKQAASWLRDQATRITGGEKPSQSFLGIRTLGDLSTYLGETVGQAAGSTLLPAVTTVAGAAVGGLTGPAGAVAGGFLGNALPNVAINGIGAMRNSVYEDPEIQKLVEDGTIAKKDLVPYIVAGGAIMGGAETFGLSKLMKIAGLGELAKEGGEKAVKEAVKLSIRKAVLEGAKTEGLTETFQQVVQEVTTVLSGGKPDVQNRLTSVFEAGVAGAVGGAALGGGGRGLTSAAQRLAIPPGQKPDPTSVDQETDPAAGTSSPGGLGAPPPQPSGGPPPTTAAGAGTTIGPGLDADAQAALAGKPLTVAGVPVPSSPPAPAAAVDVSHETQDLDDYDTPEMQEAFKAREGSASATVPSLKTLAGTPETGQQSPGAVDGDITAALSNAKGPVVDRRSEAAKRRGSRPAVAAAPSPDVGTVPAAAAPVATPNVDTGQLPGGARTPILQAETPAPLSVGAEPAQGVNPQQVQAQVPPVEPLNVNAVDAVPAAVGAPAPAPVPVEAPTQRPPAAGATEGPGSLASPAGQAAVQAPDVDVLRQVFQDLKLPSAESTTAEAPTGVASAPAPTGPAPAPATAPSAQEDGSTSAAGAPATPKGRSRAAEAARQIGDRVRQSLDPELHAQADIDATVTEILDGLAPALAEHTGSVAEMVREHAPAAEAAAKTRVDEVSQERQTSAKVAFHTSEVERAEAARAARTTARQTGEAQQRARTTAEGEKAADEIVTESEAAFARRAAKQVAEKGEAAAPHYHAGLAAIARRKATGAGAAKIGSERERERREANQQLKAAREAELAARKQEEAKTAPAPPKEIKQAEKTPEQIRAEAEAALMSAHQRQMEDLTGEREQVLTNLELPDIQRMGTRGFAEGVRAALTNLSSALLPRALDKNGKPKAVPIEKLSRDYPLWVNFMIWAKRIGQKGHEEDLLDFVTAQYLYKRGDFAAVHNMLFADDPDTALEEEQAHAGMTEDEQEFFAIPAQQGDAGYEVSEDDGFEAPDAKSYISRKAALPRASGESVTLVADDGSTTEVLPGQIHRAGDYLAAVNRAAPNFKGEGLLGRGFAFLRTMVVRRLQKLVGDVPIYVVDQAAIQAQLHPEDRGTSRIKGLYIGPTREERARGQKGKILIDTLHDADLSLGEPGELLHTTLHEMTHAATQLAIYENWNGSRDILRRIYIHARNQNLTAREYGFTAGATEEDRMAEFLAEALSNPNFQRLLADTTLPPKLAAELRALARGRATTWWDMMVAVVANAINLTGLGTGGTSALEAVLRVTPDIMFSEQEQFRKARHSMLKEGVASALRAHMDPRPLALSVQDVFEAARLRADPAGTLNSLSVLRNKFLETTQGLARKSREVFGGLNNPLERAANLFMSKQTAARRYAERGERVIAKLNVYLKSHPAAGEALTDVMHDATVAGVDPRWDESVNVANGYFSAKGKLDEWRRQVYRRVRQEWLALPAEARAIGDELSDHYGSASLDMTTQTVRNIVEEAVDKGKVLPAGETLNTVTQWVLSGEVNRQTGSTTNPRTPRDDALHAALGELATHLGQTGLFQGSKGMYVPLIREGKYLASGEVPVVVPPGAVRASSTPASLPGRKNTDHLLIFHNEADVTAYQQDADKNGIQIARVDSIWIDPTTGKRQLKQEPSSVQRWVVSVQNKVVEFHDSLTQAKDRAAEMRSQGMSNVREGQTRAEAYGSNEMMPAQVEALIRSIDRNQSDQAKSNFLTAAVREAAIRQMAGTRMQQRRLRRKGVKGFSRDLVQSGLTYNSSYANHMASLVEGRGMWKAMQEVDAYIEDPARAYAAGPEVQQRKVLRDELSRRIDPKQDYKAGSELVQIATSLSFATHLISVSYNIINAMQTGMVTLPYLIGKHGMGATFGQMGRALKDMGAETTRVVGRGLADTVRQTKRFAMLKPTDQGLDYFGQMKRRFASLSDGALLTAGLDRLNDLGLFDGMAGIDAELGEYQSGHIAKFMSRLTRVGRAMPEAIEANNRVMTLVMAIRLAVKDGAGTEEAIAAGVDAVEETQGGYSKANSPTVFNGRSMTVVLQFKKYGLMMGNLLGRNIRRVIQPKNRQERIAAAKTLTGIIATHVGMAGMVGFPFLEIPKAMAMILMPLLGGSGDWDDYERQFQGWLSKLIGGMPAEVVMRGMPRLLGIDLSNRMGLDSLFLFGQPREMKEESVLAWLLTSLAGPVAGMGIDAVRAFTSGDWTKLPVPKFVKDVTHAYQEMGGKTGKTGRETKPPTTAYETGLKAVGLRPASEARYWETGTGASRLDKQHTKDERSDLANRWLVVPKGAGQGAARSKIYNEKIRPYNVGKRGRDRIELGDLYRQERSRQKTTREEKRGEAQRLAR